jgi:hypothetical protein
MMAAAENLDYERAADLRDQIKKLERHAFGMDQPRQPVQPSQPPGSAHRPKYEGKNNDTAENSAPSKTRGRRGAGAATGAAAGAMRPIKQTKLKLIPDAPK